MAGICARSAIHSITACSLRVNDRVNEFIVFETGERLNARPGIGVYALSLSLSRSSRNEPPRGRNPRWRDDHRGKSARNVSRNNDPWKFNFPFPSWLETRSSRGFAEFLWPIPFCLRFPPNFPVHSPLLFRKKREKEERSIDFDFHFSLNLHEYNNIHGYFLISRIRFVFDIYIYIFYYINVRAKADLSANERTLDGKRNLRSRNDEKRDEQERTRGRMIKEK